MNTMIKQIEEKNLAECELSNLCVLPSFRHKGIGEKLLEHAFSVAKENSCKKINIGIVEENKRLKKWYESFGFVHVRTQKFDFFSIYLWLHGKGYSQIKKLLSKRENK